MARKDFRNGELVDMTPEEEAAFDALQARIRAEQTQLVKPLRDKVIEILVEQGLIAK